MRKERIVLILATFFVLPLVVTFVYAHTVNYDIQQKGIAVKIFYTAGDPASHSGYEIYGPSDDIPYQTGRTDKNGFLAFVPDRPGTWKIKVLGESAHGFHGVTTEIQVDKALDLKSFNKPLVATSVKLITGISIIIGLFGVYALFRARKGISSQ
jgi:nickel transport protein